MMHLAGKLISQAGVEPRQLRVGSSLAQLSKALNSMHELCPPKPKLFDSATLMSICNESHVDL